MSVDKSNSDTLIKQSLREIRRLKNQFDYIQQKANEPIAVIGVGCEFPGGATGVREFWNVLKSETNTAGEPIADRKRVEQYPNNDVEWKHHYGSYLHRDLSHFDPLFFKIPPKEANMIDPQHRLFLEVVWQALGHAGLTDKMIKGSNTGVFCGITGGDYLQQIVKEMDPSNYNMYLTTGNCSNFSAGRVSYILDLKGPSIAVDTACSSSLVAVHNACESIRRGECEMAIAGGVSLMLSSDITQALMSGNMLSSDGRCKTFDNTADGYGRGEGCGVVILKGLAQATVDNNNILALIKGSCVQHDGKKSGLTVPCSIAQKRLIKDTLTRSNYDPEDIAYIEAHGTGTPLGDPIELEALQAVLGEGRSGDDPLYVGSVKSNIGHLEAAAGIAGLIKTVLAISNQEIPAHINFTSPNDHFDWDSSKISVVTKNCNWPAKKQRIAGISSFGASGTNAHVILSEGPASSVRAIDVTSAPAPYQKVSCWFKPVDKNKAKQVETIMARGDCDDPLFVNMLSYALYEFELSVNAVPTIRQHRIFNKVILTGSIYLELAQRVVRDLCGVDTCQTIRFCNVVLIKPIDFPKATISLKLVVDKASLALDEERYRVKMFPGDCVDMSIESMYSSIDIDLLRTPQSNEKVPPYDVHEMIGKCTQVLTRQNFYESYWGSVFNIGKEFRLCDTVHRLDGKIAIGEANPQEFFKENNAHDLDRDSFTAYLLGLVFKGALPESTIRYHADIGIAFIGTGYESCTFYESLDRDKLYVIAEITESDEGNTKFVGSATILDKQSNVLCRMEKIAFCTIKPESIPNAWQEDYHTVRDEEVSYPKSASALPHPVLGPVHSKLNIFSHLNMLSYDTYPLIGDHTTFDYALFPALGYIHLALSSVGKIDPEFRFTNIDNLIVQQPIMLNSGDNYPVQTRVVRGSSGEYRYEILCYSNKDNVLNSEWVLSSSAVLSDTVVTPPVTTTNFDSSDLSSYTEYFSTEEFFKYFWGEEFILGPSYHHISGVWRKQYQALGLINSFASTKHLIGVPDLPANFLQIYMSLPIAMATVPNKYIEKVRQTEATCIAATIDKFVIYNDNSGHAYEELWSLAELRNKSDIENRWESDFSYYDKTGALVAEVKGVVFQIMKKEAVRLLRDSLTDRSLQQEPKMAVASSSEDCRIALERGLKDISGLTESQLRADINIGEMLDSIMALQLMNYLEEELAIILPLNVIGKDGTFDDLHREIITRACA
ncbi:MAG: beta-ketoacyl synthase N-terminal-like domain-containing protein [Candidatus Thiodiazotropha sp.]